MRVCVYICSYVCMRICKCMCMYTYLGMYTYTSYIARYININLERSQIYRVDKLPKPNYLFIIILYCDDV